MISALMLQFYMRALQVVAAGAAVAAAAVIKMAVMAAAAAAMVEAAMAGEADTDASRRPSRLLTAWSTTQLLS